MQFSCVYRLVCSYWIEKCDVFHEMTLLKKSNGFASYDTSKKTSISLQKNRLTFLIHHAKLHLLHV
jgi:hypothetical protein